MTSTEPIFAVRLAMTKSHASASSKPPPTHVPFTAATTGNGNDSKRWRKATGEISTEPASMARSNIVMSAPAQKCFKPLRNSTARAPAFSACSSPLSTPSISSTLRRLYGANFIVSTASGPRSRQHVVGKTCRFGHEDVDHDNELERSERVAHAGAISHRVSRVSGLDDQRAVTVRVIGEDLLGHHIARHQPTEDPLAGDRAAGARDGSSSAEKAFTSGTIVDEIC